MRLLKAQTYATCHLALNWVLDGGAIRWVVATGWDLRYPKTYEI